MEKSEDASKIVDRYTKSVDMKGDEPGSDQRLGHKAVRLWTPHLTFWPLKVLLCL